MQIKFHPEATAELESSASWYAERSPDAAREFLVAFDLTIKSIASDPLRFAPVDGLHRSCRVTRFPYQVVFRHSNSVLIIVAVAHAKRRPGYWNDRLDADAAEST